MNDNIKVAIRVRPLIKRERDCKKNWLLEGDSVSQVDENGRKLANTTYTFDRVFGEKSSTFELYNEFGRPIVMSAMEGINGTLFAYGQTSSGKTYTMSGDEDSPGIIPYALNEVFEYISKSENREFLLRVSYMEIYNEIITDLLNPRQSKLKLRETTEKEIIVEGLTEEVVTSIDDVIALMRYGEKNRHVGCTNLNEKSSRSHTIFRMIAESRETQTSDGGDIDGAVKVSHLNLVDLAGSERPSVTGAEGLRLKEGGFINRSLFALGNVINKLSEGESFFVPFRDSKLTRILQNSLGGNTKTSIICAITPASADETLSTLQFASRAKRIQNKPKVNEVLDESAMLKRYRKEINELKKKLEKSHTREEVLKREFQLKLEKDKEETKAKLFKLTKVFCTAPKDIEPRQQRQQRRWTLCPAAAHRNPFQLDVKFNSDLPSWRMEQTFAGSPSRDCEEFKIEKLNVTIEEKLRKSSGSSSEWCETQGGLFETEKKMKTEEEEEEIRSLKKQLEVQEFENAAVSNSEKDKNISELNHSLFTIREEVEQKQSVIDEKEIEILEKVGIIEQLQEKLAAVQHTATSQEIRNVELQANVEEKSRKIAELEEVVELKVTQGELMKEKEDCRRMSVESGSNLEVENLRKLEEMELENTSLRQRLEAFTRASSPEPKAKKRKKSNAEQEIIYLSDKDIGFETSQFEDKGDYDYVPSTTTDGEFETPVRARKRSKKSCSSKSSLLICACKGDCSTRRCSCKAANRDCTSCKCSSNTCKNR